MAHKWVNFGELAVLIPFPENDLVETVSMGGDKLVTDGWEAHVTYLWAGVDLGDFLKSI